MAKLLKIRAGFRTACHPPSATSIHSLQANHTKRRVDHCSTADKATAPIAQVAWSVILRVACAWIWAAIRVRGVYLAQRGCMACTVSGVHNTPVQDVEFQRARLESYSSARQAQILKITPECA